LCIGSSNVLDERAKRMWGITRKWKVRIDKLYTRKSKNKTEHMQGTTEQMGYKDEQQSRGKMKHTANEGPV